MRGSTRKRGVRWYFKHDLSPDPRTGSRRTVERGGFATKRQALAAMHESIEKVRRGEHVERDRTTLSRYFDEWLPGYAETVRPSTAMRARSMIETHVKPLIGHLELQKVKAADLEDFYSRLRRGGSGQRPLASSSVRTIHAVVSKAFSDAERHDRILRNPARLARPPRGDKSPDRYNWWSADEVRRFLEGVSDPLRRILWMFAVYTGMRRGEMLGLRWRDVDLDRGTARVVQQLVAPTNRGEFAPVKTRAGRRQVPLGADMTEVLRELRSQQVAARDFAGAAWEDHDLVFCDPLGRPLLPRSVSAWFKKDVAAGRLPPIKLHDLRHTHASLLLQQGVSPKVVQERLGHADVRMTLDTYSHVMDGLQDQAAESINRLLSAA